MKRNIGIALLTVAMTVAACGSEEAAPEVESGDSAAETVMEDEMTEEPMEAGESEEPAAAQPAPAGDSEMAALLGDSPVETAEGLRYTDLVVGDGDEAVNGSQVSVHYTGTFEDGTKFDSSLDRGAPFPFTLGTGGVIQGWDLGVAGMKVGGKRVLWIPASLAYGEAGFPGAIPPNSNLFFEVELLDVQ